MSLLQQFRSVTYFGNVHTNALSHNEIARRMVSITPRDRLKKICCCLTPFACNNLSLRPQSQRTHNFYHRHLSPTTVLGTTDTLRLPRRLGRSRRRPRSLVRPRLHHDVPAASASPRRRDRLSQNRTCLSALRHALLSCVPSARRGIADSSDSPDSLIF